MSTVAVVSPGAMGSAVAHALAAGGTRVVATLAGRSERTARLADRAGVELLPDLARVVREVDDLRERAPALVANIERRLASAASKSPRYVAEMREIAAAQAAAGLAPVLFDALADAFTALSASELARFAPEDLPRDVTLDDLLEDLRPVRRTNVGA